MSKVMWTKLNIASLSPAAQAAFAAAKVGYKKHQELQAVAHQFAIDEADALVAGGIPETHTLAFGYRFGPEPAVAVVEKKAKTAPSGAKSLADIMAAQFVPEAPRLIKKVA